MSTEQQTPGAVGSPVERPVRPDVAEALRLAVKMMRDSWATGSDAAWQPGYQALETHLHAMLAAERERLAKLVGPKSPRPCDCERCDCGNATDARMVAEWDEAAAMERRIRGA